MRILVIGAGGVGSAVVPIAVRRDFFERMVVADYDLGRAERAVARFPDDARLVAAQGGRLAPGRRRRALPRARDHPRPQRGRPALRDADLRGRLRGRRRLSRHGDVAVAPGPGRAVRADRGQAGRRAVRAGRRLGGGRTAGPVSGSASSPACPTSSPATRRITCSPRSRRSASGTGRTSSSRATTSRRRSRSGRRSRSASTRRSSGRRIAAGTRRRRSASRRSSSSRRGSARSSASTSSTRRSSSSRAGSRRGG